MSKYSGKPNLSQMAQSSWTSPETNIESILQDEQKFMEASASQNSNDTQFIDNKTSAAGGFDSDAGLQVKIPAKIKAASRAVQQEQTQQIQQQAPQVPQNPYPQTQYKQGGNYPQQQQAPRVPQKSEDQIQHELALDEAEESAKQLAFSTPKETQEHSHVTEFQDNAQQPQQVLNQNQFQNEEPQQQENIDNSQNNGEDQYILAFNLLQDLDLLRLPQNFDVSSVDAESLSLYAQATRAEQEEDALQFVRERAYKDPLVGQLFDYGFYGAEFADLPQMYGTLRQQYDYNNYDLSTEEAQEVIVKMYLSDGLDASNARDKKMLAYVPKQISQYKDENKLKKEAQVAKKYFVDQAKAQADALQKQTIQLMQEEEQRLAMEARAQVEWNQGFQRALDESKWSDGKKSSIIQENQIVKLDNGEEMPVWQYKQNIIFNDPRLFQQFLDFTSRYDVATNTFNGIEYTDKDALPREVVSNLISRIQGKNQNSTATTQQGDTKRKGKQVKPKVVNVQKDWFIGH
jgi:hypothetical protein